MKEKTVATGVEHLAAKAENRVTNDENNTDETADLKKFTTHTIFFDRLSAATDPLPHRLARFTSPELLVSCRP